MITNTMIMKSTFVGLTPANLTKAVIDEIRLIGSRCGPFDAAIRLLASGARVFADRCAAGIQANRTTVTCTDPSATLTASGGASYS